MDAFQLRSYSASLTFNYRTSRWISHTYPAETKNQDKSNNMSQANMSEPKQKITAKNLPPVIKKFDRNKLSPQYKDECRSIDLIDPSSFSKYNNNSKLFSNLF